MRFDLDPTPKKALAIGACIFTTTFVAGVAVPLNAGEMPTTVQALSSLASAVTATVTYFFGFLGYGKTEESA